MRYYRRKKNSEYDGTVIEPIKTEVQGKTKYAENVKQSKICIIRVSEKG